MERIRAHASHVCYWETPAAPSVVDMGRFADDGYLSSLPVDELKIDQSFVRQLADARGASVLETIVILAQRLGHAIVVEGVETEAQLDYLAGLGCDVAQGFLFGRPGALPAMLAEPEVA